jgi:[protein-PII] uridylyltransferase
MNPTGTELRTARAELLDRADLVGAPLRAALTERTDQWLRDLLGTEPDVALVAVGGYGRHEPAPGSDLDLVLVHRGRADIAALADRLWYPIWDSGVRLDHSVRTIPEAVAVAAADLKAALGLLDVRHVAGDEGLTIALAGKIRAAWRAGAPTRLPELRTATLERAERHGELAFLLEPDLKESRGGIRDMHALQAVAVAQVADLPGDRVRAAYAVLLDVRGELQRRTGRAVDRLLLQEQDPVAAALGFADADALLIAVAEAGRAIAYAGTETWRRVDTWAASARRRWMPRRRPPVRRPLADGVVEHDGEVVLARDVDPAADPALMLRAAAAAAAVELPLSPHTLERFRREAAPVPEPWPTEVRNALVALLGAGPAAVGVFEALDQAGLVVRLLPEWATVRSKPQRNAYHRFTVDRHLGETAAAAAPLTRRVARPDLLLLAAFLHDIGKGSPGDHIVVGAEMVGRIGPRIGLAAADAATLVTLVRHHLLLPDFATRRDLEDPATTAAVAAAVGDRDTLDLLHALTEADSLATGPAAWSEWKARLVAELVQRTAALLAGTPLPVVDPLTPAQRALATTSELALTAEPAPGTDTFMVAVAAPDRPGLLAMTAGVLALHRLDVHAATVTSVGSTAVSVFTVAARFGAVPDWSLVREDIRRALTGALWPGDRLAAREHGVRPRSGAAVAPPRVLFLDDASATATVVEVRAHDGVGVLHRIATALAAAGLDVRTAKVATLGAEVVDTFYLLDPAGNRLTDAGARSDLENRILTALTTSP